MTAPEHQHQRGARASVPAAFSASGRLRTALLSATAVAALAGLPGAADAAPDWRRGVQEQLEPNTLVRPSGITLEQAANKVRRQTGGRVLSASPAERGGERGYDIRVLLEGKRVKSYFVDDRGRILSGD